MNFFTTKVVLELELTEDQILSKVKTITTKKSLNNLINTSNVPFEGEIAEDSFTIYPLFDYGINMFGRPEILGNLEKNDIATKLHITSKFPLYFQFILIGILTINLSIVILSINVEILFHLFSLLTLLIFWYSMNRKSEKSIQILKDTLLPHE
ncbi:hypothetical protein [Mangrovimonas cancribranchiae]|uniref:Uncharacterized protein n=1 Tax=Mangrovimonas cancribranchiae TaxID=3080055 RepID=A0AAU6P4M6_9FLAO